MDRLDLFPEHLLSAVESEFLNQYWIIRASRQTNWKAVNRPRILAQVLYMFWDSALGGQGGAILFEVEGV